MTNFLYTLAVVGAVIALATGSITAMGMGLIAALAAIQRGTR